jgi:starch-binding outer membrane protein, SusD/RagB family
MKNFIVKAFSMALLTATLVVSSCVDRLDVPYLNEPDSKKALSTPGDVISLAGGAFKTWYNRTQDYDGPALAMATMADQLTCSWGNAAMRDLSSEPRKGWDNGVSYPYSPVNKNYWQGLYGSLSAVNDAMIILKAGELDFGEDAKMLEAWCRFMQGINLGYIALVFDKGVIVDETSDLGALTAVPYQDVAAAAITYLDQAIAIADANTFDIPSTFINGFNDLTNVELSQMANSFAARILVYTSRNAAANNSVDWAKVLQYAQNGITFDMDILGNDYWYDSYKDYAVYNGWGRIDHRIINLMDNNYPSRWPNSATFPDPQQATTSDLRLGLYFQYLADNAFNPTRGYYHFSHYRLKRWDYWQASYFEPVPNFLKAENDLFIAEAMLRTGDITGAIGVINAGTRVNVGGLAPLSGSSTADQVNEAIFYERDIELCITGMGISFFDMRRRDMLQSGSILHWPIPGIELESMNMEFYTINGAPDGVNISEGHWVGKDGLVSPPPAK